MTNFSSSDDIQLPTKIMPTKIITDKVFTDKVLVYFLNHMSIFGKSEPANVVTEGYSEKIHKNIWKALVKSTFLVKLWTYNPEVSD